MSRGSRRCACATLVCTSWSARSTSRARSSSTVMLRRPLARGGGDRAHALDLHEGLFEDLDDVVLDDLGRGAFPGHVDGDGREVDVGELADADARRRDGAEEDGRGHEHPGEDRLLDAGFGELHDDSFRSWPPPGAARGRPAAAWSSRRRADPHRRAVAQRLGAADHEQLPGAEAGAHLDPPVGGAHPEGQDALLRDVGFHHVGEKPVLAGPHRRLRHDGRGGRSSDRHRDLGERARPQRGALGIIHAGGDGHHARGLVGRRGHVGDPGGVVAAHVADPEAGRACPAAAGPASGSGTWKRSSSGSRRTSVARTAPGCTYCPVCTLRVWISPGTGARTYASRRFSSARSSADLACATSAAAVRTRVRQVSRSSSLTRAGFFSLTATRRASPACASAWAACCFSTAARADRTARRYRSGSISTRTVPGFTRLPSAKWTLSTAPGTREVTSTRSNASTEPTAETVYSTGARPLSRPPRETPRFARGRRPGCPLHGPAFPRRSCSSTPRRAGAEPAKRGFFPRPAGSHGAFSVSEVAATGGGGGEAEGHCPTAWSRESSASRSAKR